MGAGKRLNFSEAEKLLAIENTLLLDNFYNSVREFLEREFKSKGIIFPSDVRLNVLQDVSIFLTTSPEVKAVLAKDFATPNPNCEIFTEHLFSCSGITISIRRQNYGDNPEFRSVEIFLE